MKYTDILGKDHELYFMKSSYDYHGALAIQIMEKMEDGYDEPFCSLTVNLPESEKGKTGSI